MDLQICSWSSGDRQRDEASIPWRAPDDADAGAMIQPRTAASASRSRLVICAEDFGLSQAISQAIVILAQRGKLNAVSCVAARPGWGSDATLLKKLPRTVEVGLQLTLTLEQPLSAPRRLAPDGQMPSWKALGRRALLHRLPLDEIRTEVGAQFDRFVELAGRPPDFVDARHNVHALPGIRGIILEETARRAPAAWVRNRVDTADAILSRQFPMMALVAAALSLGLSSAAARHGLRCNDSFAGLYDFGVDYASVFPRFLENPGKFHLVICHPGGGQIPRDGIAQARRLEAAALRKMPIHEMATARGLHF